MKPQLNKDRATNVAKEQPKSSDGKTDGSAKSAISGTTAKKKTVLTVCSTPEDVPPFYLGGCI